MLARHIPDPPTLIGPIGVFTARSLPILAMRVACGFPSPAEDFFREDDRLDLNEKLTGELSAGWLSEDFDDATLVDISALVPEPESVRVTSIVGQVNGGVVQLFWAALPQP